jgi:hypothetical protein
MEKNNSKVIKKRFILSILLLCTRSTLFAFITNGGLTNNGSVQVNVVMYSNYIAPTATNSARGRLNTQGVIIPAGQNINFVPGTTSIDVYYGNGNVAGIHYDVNVNFSYTITPGNQGWTITQDIT